MYLRPYTSTPADGSRTLTAHDSPPEESTVIAANPSANETPTRTVGTLRLRGGLLVPATRQRVAWDEDVVDNEGCGRKSSKSVCSSAAVLPPLLTDVVWFFFFFFLGGVASMLHISQTKEVRRVVRLRLLR
jgi:hypothetical protein